MCRVGSHLETKTPFPLSTPTMCARGGRKHKRSTPPRRGAWHTAGPRGHPLPGRSGRHRRGRCTQGPDGEITEVGSRQHDNLGELALGWPQSTQDRLERSLSDHHALPPKQLWSHYQDKGFLGGLKSPEKPDQHTSQDTRLGDLAPPWSLCNRSLSVVPLTRGGGACLGLQRWDPVFEGLPGMRHTHST